MWGPKNCGCKTIFGFKINLGSKKNLGPKNFWVQQNFDTKQILGLKKFLVPRNFGCKKILGPKTNRWSNQPTLKVGLSSDQ